MTRAGLPYTPEEIAYIRSRWGEARALVIAAELGRTKRGIRKAAAKWGLTRTAKQKSAIHRQWERHRGPKPRREVVAHG